MYVRIHIIMHYTYTLSFILGRRIIIARELFVPFLWDANELSILFGVWILDICVGIVGNLVQCKIIVKLEMLILLHILIYVVFRCNGICIRLDSWWKRVFISCSNYAYFIHCFYALLLLYGVYLRTISSWQCLATTSLWFIMVFMCWLYSYSISIYFCADT